jgi:hypothetical protein
LLFGTFPPPYRVRMCGDGLVLCAQECVGVELVRVQCSESVIFNAGPGYWVVVSDWDLGKNIVPLDWDEDVVGRYLADRGGLSVGEGSDNVLPKVAP